MMMEIILWAIVVLFALALVSGMARHVMFGE